MIPFRVNHILHYLVWGAQWKCPGMHVGWTKWRPALNEARGKHHRRRTLVPEDWGKGEAVEEECASRL